MRISILIAAFGAAILAGCSKNPGAEQFIPPAANARQALDAALTRWKGGQSPEKFPFENATVQIADAAWASGLKLTGFEIVSEEANEGPRAFNVKLKTSRGEQALKYYIVGIDPLWIYAEADYKKMSGG